MKRRYADRRNTNDILEKEIRIKKIDEEYFKGYISYLKIKKVRKEWFVDEENRCILAKDYTWFNIYPKDENYCINAMIDENGEIIQWYFDVAKNLGVEDGVPYEDDLYLDVVIVSNGKINILDEDELDEAYNKDEAEKLLNTLKKKKLIDDKTSSYILKYNSKGYNNNTINYVLINLNNKEKTEILSKKYDKDFEEYITLDLFNYKKYKRYLEFQKKNPDISLDDVVTRIELNLDKDYYEDPEEEKNPDSITCLVNKYRYLPESYEPSDLVDMEDEYANNKYGSKKRLRKEAYEAFKTMVDDAKKQNVTFYAESAYRTYKFQEEIYNSYVNNYGKDYANEYAAVPGYSEHQTGLSVDLANIWTITKNGDEFKWLTKNSYKYGWVFRYAEDKVDVTGFNAEEWHIRYVGKDVAKILHDKNLTLDEYYVKYIKKSK